MSTQTTAARRAEQQVDLHYEKNRASEQVDVHYYIICTLQTSSLLLVFVFLFFAFRVVFLPVMLPLPFEI